MSNLSPCARHPFRLRPHGLPAALLLVLSLMALIAPRAVRAATYTVVTTNPSGLGSLDAALAAAGSGDTITFAVTGVINLDQELIPRNGVTIQGPGAATLALDGGGSIEIFHVNSGSTVTISGLTIRNGYNDTTSSTEAGGVSNSGDLTLLSCVLTGNRHEYCSALNNNGTAQVLGCSFFGNGDIKFSGPAVFNQDTVTMTNCVLAGNAGFTGGAMLNSGMATLTDCTITGNTAQGAGGIYTAIGYEYSSVTTLTNDSIYGDNGEGDPNEVNGYGTVAFTHCDIGQSNFTGPGAIDADPLFVNAATMPYNLRVQPGSPCLGLGIPVPNVTTDIAGNPRDQNHPTLGAYEVPEAITATALVSSSNPSLSGQSVTFTATVTNTSVGGSPVTNGSVAFTLNGSSTPFATVTLDTSGKASASAAALPIGNDQISAVYVPAGPNFIGSSHTLTQTVQTGTTTALLADHNFSVYGQSVTFTATVSANTAGVGTPTGTISFSDAGIPLGDVTLTSGSAQFSTSTLPAGSHRIQAIYTPDTSAFAGSGMALSQTVTPASVSLSIGASPSPSTAGQSVTFPVTITDVSTGSAAVPTGSIAFFLGSSSTPFATVALSPSGATGQAAAQAMQTFTSAGQYTITAQYINSDGDFQGGDSIQRFQTVAGVGTTTKLTSSLNPSILTQNVTIFATIDTHGGPAPVGNVQFSINGNPLVTVAVSNAKAGFQTSGLNVGTDTVTAVFTGSGFQTSSDTLNQIVNPATVIGVSVGWGTQTAPLVPGAELPWLGISKLVVTLDVPAGIASGDVTLTGTNGANYGPVTVSSSGSVYTLTLARPITSPDRLTLSIGNPGVSSYNSPFSVLPGDVNGDGAVNASDLTLVKNAIGKANSQTDDIDGSGAVDVTDYNDVRQRVSTRLP